MKRSEFLKAAAAGGFLAAAGLPRAARAQADGTLRAGLKLSPTSMDPHFRLSGEQSLLRALHARFVGMSADGKPEPGIAERWRPVNDGMAWEFTLRADAKFSDGTPITAEDAAYSIARVPTITGSAAPTTSSSAPSRGPR